MEQGSYQLVATDDKDDVLNVSEADRARLLRKINRDVRSKSSLGTFGWDGTLYWLFQATWMTFVAYSIYGIGLVVFYYKVGATVKDFFELPDGSPLMHCVQFLAAFLTGLTMTEAATRYKAAMAALLNFMNAVETLRTTIVSSTSDPKIRVSTQVFIAWMIVLSQKSIVFFTEDFSLPVIELISNQISHSILFKTQVLWKFESQQCEYLFSTFIIGAQVWDHREKTVAACWSAALKSWNELYELLTVHSPTTKFTVGKLAVHLFLLMIPILHDDFWSALALPVVASMFMAVLQLAYELADPWHGGLHGLPLNDVLRYLAWPNWGQCDQGHIHEAVTWLNRGLEFDEWTSDKEPKVPRKKMNEPNKGEVIDFDRMSTLPSVAGYKTWAGFMSSQDTDIASALKNGRRMPVYLAWNQRLTG